MKTTKAKRKTWRCFHCGEVFRSEHCAAVHFGPSQMSETACQVDIKEYRRIKKLISDYANEDTALHRQMARMESDHQLALRREEEKGYARGLRDGRQLTLSP